MKLSNYSKKCKRLLSWLLCASLTAGPLLAQAEDIDIFIPPPSRADRPKVLFVLDNTANWSRNDQKFPNKTQGEAEISAIHQVVSNLPLDKIDVGMMEFVTQNGNGDGGFIRIDVQQLTSAHKTKFLTTLNTMATNIRQPSEKRNAGAPYGDLMWDVHNYFAGANVVSPNGTATGLPDPDGYTTQFSRFASPIASTDVCSKSFVIFIGNPPQSGPSADSVDNLAALTLYQNGVAGGPAISQLPLPDVTQSNVPVNVTVGVTQNCHASASAAASELPALLTTCTNDYGGPCTIGAPTTPTGPLTCPAGQLSYTVMQTTYPAGGGAPVVDAPVTAPPSVTTYYYESASAVPASDTGTLVCPQNTVATSNGTTTSTSYSCTFAVGAVSATTPASTSDRDACFTGIGTGAGEWDANSTNQGGHVCPTGSTCTYTGKAKGGGKTCPDKIVTITQQVAPKYRFVRTMTSTRTTTTGTGGGAAPTTQSLGMTAACHGAGASNTGDYAGACNLPNTTCALTTPTLPTATSCPAGTSLYKIDYFGTADTNVITGSTSPDTGTFNADEWARALNERGYAVPGSTVRPSVTTYTIDVYREKPNAKQTSLLMSMAQAGGGTYYSATNEQAIVDALTSIFVDIQAVNSAFAATSLPVNATNRSQNENQVFIGMFRPDTDPRWAGNLKRYEIIPKGTGVTLGITKSDGTTREAVSTTTGFIYDCAISYWTRDTTDYWNITGYAPSAASKCTTDTNLYSDLSDGAFVEKGGAAQVLRQGNSATAAVTSRALNRTMYSESGGSLVAFSATSGGTTLTADVASFIKGADVNQEKPGSTLLAPLTRPSIHGDVIHSRPLPVNYGPTYGVVVFYGANDGALHAVNADTGVEHWSFVAPEFRDRLPRLKANAPSVRLFGGTTGDKKDYFFDGSIGLIQTLTNDKVWIFPTMRRGGRMVYALNVGNPTAPVLKWKKGCTNLVPATAPALDDCTTGMGQIGQTWSLPRSFKVKGATPAADVRLLIMGGGYDNCEDTDAIIVSQCAATKGNRVYVLNADNGDLVAWFSTTRGVAADISLVDVNSDGYADYAYAADLGGTIYRMDFIASPSATTPLAYADWSIRKIAYTNTAGRKFLFAPSTLTLGTSVYLAIGSGDREHPLAANYPFPRTTAPVNAGVTNRFYVYRDDLVAAAVPVTVPPTVAPVIDTVLSTGTSVPTGGYDLDTLTNYTTPSACNTPSVFPSSGLRGWFMDLTANGVGEQTVSGSLIVGGQVSFNTNKPDTSSASTCGNLGKAYGYWVNLFNGAGAVGVGGACGGTRSQEYLGGGLPPSPVLAQAVRVGDRNIDVTFATPAKSGGRKPPPAPEAWAGRLNSKRVRAYSATVGD